MRAFNKKRKPKHSVTNMYYEFGIYMLKCKNTKSKTYREFIIDKNLKISFTGRQRKAKPYHLLEKFIVSTKNAVECI